MSSLTYKLRCGPRSRSGILPHNSSSTISSSIVNLIDSSTSTSKSTSCSLLHHHSKSHLNSKSKFFHNFTNCRSPSIHFNYCIQLFCLTTVLLLTGPLQVQHVNGQQLLQVPNVVTPLPPAPPPQIISDDFSPLVTAQCDRGIMHITIVTQEPFYGVAHTRDLRKSPCLVNGMGSHNTTLKISLLAGPDDELYCGVQRYKGERSVSLAVRMHRSLELSEDRFFYLTCHSGYKNVRGGTYRVNLKLIDSAGTRVNRLIHGMAYSLRAELTPKDSVTTLRIKNCFVFAKSTDHVELIDRSGCPALSGLITSFHYNDSASGEALIPEMFKFPEDVKVHFQCDALLCREDCDEPDCEGTSKAREFELDGYSQVSASTSVYIREPLDSDALSDPTSPDGIGECTEWRFPWLITLCICLAIMLLVMLLLNLFMCSSLTCRCTKTELNEKEPGSEIEDYDPYRADWTAPNSLHGSRYSLENARKGGTGDVQRQRDGYTDDDTVRSETTDPDYDNRSYVPDRQFVTNPSQQAHQQLQQQPDRPSRHRRHADEDSSDEDQEDIQTGVNGRPYSRGSLRPIRSKEVEYPNNNGYFNGPAHRF